jgi:hypothetical protein
VGRDLRPASARALGLLANRPDLVLYGAVSQRCDLVGVYLLVGGPHGRVGLSHGRSGACRQSPVMVEHRRPKSSKPGPRDFMPLARGSRTTLPRRRLTSFTPTFCRVRARLARLFSTVASRLTWLCTPVVGIGCRAFLALALGRWLLSRVFLLRRLPLITVPGMTLALSAVCLAVS